MSLNLEKQIEEIGENPTKKAYFTSILIGLFLILSILLTVPTINSLLSLNKEVTAAVKTDVQLKEKLNNLQEAANNYSQIRSSIGIVNSAFPDNPEITSLIKNLESIASKSAVKIANIQIGEALLSQSSASAALKTTQAQTFTLTLSGSYPNLKDYIKNLEDLVRTTSVETIGFSTKSEGTESLTITVSAKTYYFGAGKSVKKKETSGDTQELGKGAK